MGRYSLGMKFLPLLTAAVMILSAIAFTPAPVFAVNPPCGSVLIANTTLKGVITCASPVGYTIGSAGITIVCKAATLVGPGSGIGIYNPGFASVTIKNCDVKDFDTGIGIRDSPNNILTGNYAYDNTGPGFVVFDSNSSSLLKNSAYFDAAGFFMNYSSGVTLQLNKGYDSTAFEGFGAYASSGNKLISNTASGNAEDGFSFGSGFTSNIILSNTAVGNDLVGFSLSGSSANVIQANKATANLGDGFVLNNTSDLNLLYSNKAAGNGGDGFHLASSSSNNLISNTALRNSVDGFHFESTATHNSIIDNTALVNGRYRCYDGTGLFAPLQNFYFGNSGTPVGPAYSVPSGLFPS